MSRLNMDDNKSIVFITTINCKCKKETISICNSFRNFCEISRSKQAKKILGSIDDILNICKNTCYDQYEDDADGDAQVCKEFKININAVTPNIISNIGWPEFIMEIKSDLSFTY